MIKKGLVWIRRDIRLHDHAALSASLAENDITYLVFIFDSLLLDTLKKDDARVHFISNSLLEVATTLQKQQAGLILLKGNPVEKIPQLLQTHHINTLYFNRDYEPYAKTRDNSIKQSCSDIGIQIKEFKDQVILEPHEILNQSNLPYKVFTPYSQTWKKQCFNNISLITPHECNLSSLRNDITARFNSIEEILSIAGFTPNPPFLKGGFKEGLSQLHAFETLINTYDHDRDFPDLDHTSKLSVYIRHGCISIRDMVNLALKYNSNGADIWLNELIWREFYTMILFHFPHVTHTSYNPKYTHLIFPGSNEHFDAWKMGQTGVPIVDAAMRCLNQTGWMHNRLRMIVASYLCKILLVDWRKGESYFAKTLLDFDLASNNGGWQWSSSTGCDASPYFRIFNPYTQSKKFDAKGTFIKRYCPELTSLSPDKVHEPPRLVDYPQPIVDYADMRKKAILHYKSIIN